jgi:hypothetical protein
MAGARIALQQDHLIPTSNIAGWPACYTAQMLI